VLSPVPGIEYVHHRKECKRKQEILFSKSGINTLLPVSKNGTYKKWDYVRNKNHITHLQKSWKMAKPRPYNPLPHGFIWPLLGQKSSHKKCYQTEIFATSARVIWPRAVALPDGFTIPWLPSCTADDFLHHEQTAGK
jgi:hypothetical protein